jgi:acyl-CoA reductase-like NAD-dependent aldehyde dehydrogenase
LLQIVQAYDRCPIAEVETEGADAPEAKLEMASCSFRDRDQWLKPCERSEVRYRLAALMEPLRDEFSRLIAQEGGKPLADANIEVTRAIDGVRTRSRGISQFRRPRDPNGGDCGQHGTVGLHSQGADRRCRRHLSFQPSDESHRAPGGACDRRRLPVIVKPAPVTPLCCQKFARLVREAGLAEPWCQSFLPSDNALAERLVTDSRRRHSGNCIGGIPWSMREITQEKMIVLRQG